MTTRSAKRKRAATTGDNATGASESAVIELLTEWGIEHPGQYRVFSPRAPKSKGERVPVYVVTSPEVPDVPAPVGYQAGPTVQVHMLTADEAMQLTADLGHHPPGN